MQQKTHWKIYYPVLELNEIQRQFLNDNARNKNANPFNPQ